MSEQNFFNKIKISELKGIKISVINSYKDHLIVGDVEGNVVNLWFFASLAWYNINQQLQGLRKEDEYGERIDQIRSGYSV